MATDTLKACRGLPPIDAGEEHVKQFLDRHFNGGKKSRFRRWHMQRMALNVWFYRGRHWIKPVDNLTADTATGTFRFREIYRRSGLDFSRPVDNLIAEGVDAMVARLGRKEYVPDTRPDKHTPEIEQAAKLAKDIMLHDLEMMYWAEKREQINFDVACPGTAIARSYWDETQTQLMVLSSPHAAQCPTCGQKYASRNVPEAYARMGVIAGGEGGIYEPFRHRESVTSVESDEANRPDEVRMQFCPACDEPAELQDYAPSLEEAEGEKDVFGRPLGFSLPKGEGLIEVVSWSDFYPENGGIGVEPDSCKLWAQETVRSLDWIASREPEYADDIEPEDPRELIRSHPTLGDDAFSGGGPHGDQEMYAYHHRVQEMVIEPLPLPGLERGRFIRRIGDHLCKDVALTVDVETPDGELKQVPRIKYAAARQKRVPGEFWGRSRVDDARPLNQRLNQLDAMDDDITEKGFPRVVLPSGAEFKEDESAVGSFSLVETTAHEAVPDWRVKDSVLFQQPVTGNAYHEKRGILVQAIRDKLGVGEFEISGQNPVNVKTVGQLQILAEQTALNRGTLERNLARLMDTIFTHHMEITWALRKEDTEFEVQSEAGDYERDSYVGTDLLGQVKVKVEPKGDFDRTVFQQMKVQEGIGLGLYNEAMASEAGRNELRELGGWPKVDTNESVQTERAEYACMNFLRFGTIPIVDETIDAPATWFHVLGRRWQGDEFQKIRRETNADKVIEALAGWERRLTEMEAANEQARAVYSGFPPEQWDAIYQEGLAKSQGTGFAFPQPPMAGRFLPESLTQRIVLVFRQTLGPEVWPEVPPMPPMDGKPVVDLGKVLEFYAVIQTYRKLQQATQMAPVMAPGATAGGSPSPTGTIAPPPTPAGTLEPAEAFPT